jgi:Domain of unknown function (DUF4384)
VRWGIFFLAVALASGQTGGEPGVAVQVVLEKRTDSKWIAVDPHQVLHGKDEIRFRFRSNRSGFLYVINHEPQGQHTWLFPTPETGEHNAVEADKDYVIPATDGVFVLAEKPGYETTYWILSPTELRPRGTLESDAPVENTLIPRCDDGPLVARGPCSDKKAGARRFAAVGTPQWFENAAPLQSRDLKFKSNNERSSVSLGRAFDAPVIYEFRIAHN